VPLEDFEYYVDRTLRPNVLELAGQFVSKPATEANESIRSSRERTQLPDLKILVDCELGRSPWISAPFEGCVIGVTRAGSIFEQRITSATSPAISGIQLLLALSVSRVGWTDIQCAMSISLAYQ
jgi:hypothetical protein